MTVITAYVLYNWSTFGGNFWEEMSGGEMSRCPSDICNPAAVMGRA